jgi:acyl-coenzyme A synthetase/AMP-(fatty) acid ligase/acyl carrier protein
MTPRPDAGLREPGALTRTRDGWAGLPGEPGRPGRCPVVGAFEQQADAAADRPAVILPEGTVCYGELSARADAVAQELLAGLGDEPTAIPLMVLDPGWMLAAALGVLKAGMFYAPLNPLHPAARNRALLAQLGAAVTVVDAAGLARPGLAGAGLAGAGIMDVAALRVEPYSAGRRGGVAVRPGQWAYVLHTSGSTGRPKGILQCRADMYHNVLRHAPLGIGPDDRVTLLSADGFISAVSNVYAALLNGAALVPYSFHRDGVHDLVHWLEQTGVTVFYSFPSFLRQAAADGCGQATRVRLAYLGGEAVHRGDVLAARRLFPRATVAVGLNSTETGLTRLRMFPPDADIPDPVPVGGPVLDVDLRVLDEAGLPAATGEPGEIVVRSAHVRPVLWAADGPVELTQRLGDESGLREFRTGDRGRFDQTGELIHLGRADGMVKVRGYRVEVAEVEGAVSALPGVAEAAVVPYEAAPGEIELAAHIVAKDPALRAADIRRSLARSLPVALVPASINLTAALPRTRNGKVSRSDLTVPGPAARPGLSRAPAGAAAAGPAGPPGRPAADAAGPSAASQADIAARVAGIWRDILGVDSVHSDDDFFTLGGTSISALRVISRIRKEFGVPVRLAILFETPSIDALAGAVSLLLPGSGH